MHDTLKKGKERQGAAQHPEIRRWIAREDYEQALRCATW
jgi:hypothetical protein